MATRSNGLKIAGLIIATLWLSACNKQTEIAQADNAQTQSAAKITIGNQVDDTVVTAKVKTALMADADIKGLDIKVETRKGEVLLSGFVDNQAQIDRGIAVTRNVEGVKNVDNRLNIKQANATVGNKIDDSVVTTKVKSALLGDSSLKSLDIAVVTNMGNVQLSGFVDNDAQRTRAAQVAKNVEGVVMVTDEMNIKK